MKVLIDLKKCIVNDIKECQRFSKQMGMSGEYLDAIKLLAMVDAYKKIAWRIDKILNEEEKRPTKEGE